MPRRRPPQPVTPDNLADIPIGATKKEYYPAGNLVYYLQSSDSQEWRRGEVSDDTTSTSLHVIIDEATGNTYNVRSQYIRERQPDRPGHEILIDGEGGYETTTAGPSSSSASQEWFPSHTRTDSGGSDPLAWDTERYEQETRRIDNVVDTRNEQEAGTVDELGDTLQQTYIGEDPILPTAWSEWHEDQNMEGRYRMVGGEYEYEWREPKASGKHKPKKHKKKK